MFLTRKIDPADRAELERLNAAVDAAVEARTKWLDAAMERYTPVKIGEPLFDLETGQQLGIVEGYYRFWANQGDWRHDRSISVDLYYRGGGFYGGTIGGNTSSQIGRDFGSRDDLVRRRELELARLKG